MTIRIPKDELEVAKALAQKQGISLNAYLLLLIHNSIFSMISFVFLDTFVNEKFDLHGNGTFFRGSDVLNLIKVIFLHTESELTFVCWH